MRNADDLRVTIIEDDPAMRAVLGEFLEYEGLTVESYSNPTEFFARQKERANPPPKVLISDINMPNMNGFELLAEIRASHPWIPVMLISSDATPTKEAHAFALGASDFLRKPFALDHFFGRVAALLSAASAPAAEQAKLK